MTATHAAPVRPAVSVVVAVHGNVGALAGLVSAIADQDYPLSAIELVVVDNHAEPTVTAGLLNGAPVAHVLVHEPRLGLSRARNSGIRQASGDYILVTDPDARPEQAWVRRLIDALQETGAYLAGGKVVPRFTGTASRERCLDAGVMRLFVPPLWPERTCRLEPPYWLVGCNLAVRRAPLPRFDERLGARPGHRLRCEDLELVIRAERDGLQVVVVPDAVVHRAVDPADIRASAILGRALWHGVSIARLRRLHPDAAIFDSYRIRDALRSIRPTRKASWLAALADLSRIAGRRAEQVRLARAGGPGNASGDQLPAIQQGRGGERGWVANRSRSG